jgi:hypothetical protein
MVEKKMNMAARTKFASVTTSIIGGTGAVIGASIGATISGLLTGGLGAGAGGALGAQIGGGLGAAVGGGSVFIFYDAEDTRDAKIAPDEIKKMAVYNFAIIWAFSNIGFGRDSELTQVEIKNIQQEIVNLPSLKSDVDWRKLSEQQIVQYCEKIFNALEKA